jgi:hypothetical protein
MEPHALSAYSLPHQGGSGTYRTLAVHQQEAIATRMRRWDRPIHDFLAPYFRGAVARVTGEDVIRRRSSTAGIWTR